MIGGNIYMSFESKTWVTGEVITADDLNLITPLVDKLVPGADDTYATTNTAEDIYNALSDGRIVFLQDSNAEAGFATLDVALVCYITSGTYYLKAVTYDVSEDKLALKTFEASSASDHLTYTGGGK